jgi:hypothetical protein
MTAQEFQEDYPHLWAEIYAAGRREGAKARAVIQRARAEDQAPAEPLPDPDPPPVPPKPYDQMTDKEKVDYLGKALLEAQKTIAEFARTNTEANRGDINITVAANRALQDGAKCVGIPAGPGKKASEAILAALRKRSFQK